MPDNTATEKRAYELWEAEGRPHGRHDDHWHAAEHEISAQSKKNASAPGNEGEGSRSGARAYNKATEKFVKSGKVKAAAKSAAKALDGPEADELAKAEKAGKRKSKGEDPALKR